MLATVVTLCLLFVPLRAQRSSAAEPDLKAQLAAAKEKLAASEREKALLSAAVVRMSSTQMSVAKAAQESHNNASSEAASAQLTAEMNAQAAQVAVIAAVSVAATMKEQLAETQRAVQSSHMALLITQVFGFVSVLIGIVYKSWSDRRERRWDQQDTAGKFDAVKAVGTANRADINASKADIAAIKRSDSDGEKGPVL